MESSIKAKAYPARAGLTMSIVNILLFILGIAFIGFGDFPPLGWLLLTLSIIMLRGYMVISPQKSMVLLLFGQYQGYMDQAGFYWVHPLFLKKKYNSNIQYLKLPKLTLTDSNGMVLQVGSHIKWGIIDPEKALGNLNALDNVVEAEVSASTTHLFSTLPYNKQSKKGEGAKQIKGHKAWLERAIWDNANKRLQGTGVSLKEVALTSILPPEAWQEKWQSLHWQMEEKKDLALQAMPIARHLIRQWKAINDAPTLNEEQERELMSKLLIALCKE